MPITPRPIPSHQRHPRRNYSSRPGSGVARKSLPTFQLQQQEWRAEVALLPKAAPRSAPQGSFITLAAVESSDKKNSVSGSLEGRREVGLERLIIDGKGKREKRATMAKTFGFDFVPNPSIIPLPDVPLAGMSLLSASKVVYPTPAEASLALATTPETPALLAERFNEEDEDDWEHISPVDERGESRTEEERDDNICSDGEEDVIVLGEMEMEHSIEDARPEVDGKEAFSGQESKPTYAAAVGRL
ncbi:uncharacterized protein L203_100066 [Cryptococcus depauperatus CBS 7841]|uniref:Uncharacterized protein n=1 Tax=Cryptococcus depauperatus CBS 7841 TaxID=1295531 RepID=A0A1E3IZS8_9TREE|nr:hypothetical protein L203_00275 [Cryptococcus depauperatus CBS 7841]